MATTTTTTSSPSSSRRPELAADAAWDAALDLGLRRTVYGTLGGIVAAAVLFRESVVDEDCSERKRKKKKKKKKNPRGAAVEPRGPGGRGEFLGKGAGLLGGTLNFFFFFFFNFF